VTAAARLRIADRLGGIRREARRRSADVRSAAAGPRPAGDAQQSPADEQAALRREHRPPHAADGGGAGRRLGSGDSVARDPRVVGTGSLDRASANGLHDVLVEWQRADPEIGALIPDASMSPREIASALRYLASTRQMEKHTAAMVAQWLEPVMTPGISR
jgi:hypothetical protein